MGEMVGGRIGGGERVEERIGREGELGGRGMDRGRGHVVGVVRARCGSRWSGQASFQLDSTLARC